MRGFTKRKEEDDLELKEGCLNRAEDAVNGEEVERGKICLLYTSDAADE